MIVAGLSGTARGPVILDREANELARPTAIEQQQHVAVFSRLPLIERRHLRVSSPAPDRLTRSRHPAGCPVLLPDCRLPRPHARHPAHALQPRIPKLRQGSYLPPFLEARKCSEKALIAVIQEAPS
jgi:hypothetical protein